MGTLPGQTGGVYHFRAPRFFPRINLPRAYGQTSTDVVLQLPAANQG